MAPASTVHGAFAEHVRGGVFFMPQALPRGRHKLSREQVRRTQRERLLAAVTELLAAYGYRGFAVGDIATRAGVSLGTFYQCFESKEACVFAGYERFSQVVFNRIAGVSACVGDRSGLVSVVIKTYVETLAEDPVVARAYHLEVDALGTDARAQLREAMRTLAEHLRDRVAAISPNGAPHPHVPWSAYVGVMYAVRQLACDALDAENEPDFRTLSAELESWFRDVFRDRGPISAPRQRRARGSGARS
jgi:AcrR family transcriptional regulator